MPLGPRQRSRVITVEVTQVGVGTGLQQYPTDIHVTAHGRQH
jgi:hypothetical protein